MAHDSNTPEATRKKRYLQIMGIMVILTLAAFGLVIFAHLPVQILAVTILLMAVIQVILQVYLFMHLNVGRRAYSAFFGAGLGIAVLFSVALFLILRVG